MSHELIACLREVKRFGTASQWPELCARARRQNLADFARSRVDTAPSIGMHPIARTSPA